ncbi:MAG TPA: DUF302 domain-containing protein [Crocinitomix sp.]|nr:DUF302 domain-containing protein [Crocinitomix sp.]
MSYYIETLLRDITIDKAVELVTEELKKEGFGIITEIDMKATFKNKLDVDFQPYKILGACNPQFAHEALNHNAYVGVFLPCNVIVRQKDNNSVEVFAVDPVTTMTVVDDTELSKMADTIRVKLIKVIDGLFHLT